MSPGLLLLARVAGLVAALLVTVPGMLDPLRGGLLAGVNLVFHEAGHVVFSPFGETLMLLGGSLLQVTVPLACAGALLVRGDRYGAGVLGLWLAHSLASVAAYVRDAPTRTLDLITGDPDTHDWWQLLGAAGHLDWAAPLGRVIAFLAFVAVVLSLLLAVWQPEARQRD